MSSGDVAVIGGGIAGLAAAQHLTASGRKATVYEAADRIGGRAASEEADGFIIDTGAYTFPDSHRTLRRHLEGLGMGGALLPTEGTAATILDGRTHAVKIGSVLDFLRYRLLGGGDKAYLASLFVRARLNRGALNFYSPTENTLRLDREDMATFLRRSGRTDILERIAEPICSELFLGAPEANSVAALLATLGNLLSFRIFAMDRGMGQVAAALARGLDVRRATPVHRVEVDAAGDGVRVTTPDGSARHTAAIIAIPAPVVPQLVPDLPQELARYFRFVEYAPAVVVAIALDTPPPNRALITSLVRSQYPTVATVVRDNGKTPRRVPSGAGLVTAILHEPAARRLFDAPDETVVSAVLGDLGRAFPGIERSIRFFRLYRWQHAAVQMRPGLLRMQRAARPGLQAGHGPIQFAGDGLYFSGAEAAFRTGIAAARRVMGG